MMKKSSTAALAVGVGYVLGRRHKLRWALLFAAAATTGSLSGRLMKQGGKLLGSSDALAKVSPELGKLASTVKGDLADAGKAAAKAAVTSRVDSLAGSLHDKAEAIRAPRGEASDEEDDSDREAGPDEDAGPDEEAGPDETAPDRRSSARPRQSPGKDKEDRDGPAQAASPPRPRRGERESQASRTGRGQK